MNANRICLLVFLSICLLLAACTPPPASPPPIGSDTPPGPGETSTATPAVIAEPSIPPTATPSAPTGTATSSNEASFTPIVATCPLYVYQNWSTPAKGFVPEGFMGDTADVVMDDNYKLDPERPDVIRIAYAPQGPNQFSGIYWWQPPRENFGVRNGGYDISCATKLTFWARGEKGGEVAEFKVGGINGTYKDSLQPAESTGPIVLTGKWVKYVLLLTNKDLSRIMGGFVWAANLDKNPTGAVIFLDDIKFER